MLTRYGHIVATVAMLAVFTVGVGAETLEEVEKKVIAANKEIESYSADIVYEMEMEQPAYTAKGHGQGTHEYLRKDGKTMSRSEMKMTQEVKFGDQSTEMESTILNITDGEYAYTLTEQAGTQTAVKTKVDPTQQGVVNKQMFDNLRKDNELKLLPNEKVNGTDVYVIQATPKNESAPAGPTKFYISKDHGLMRKLVTMSKDGKPMMTIEYKNVKPNAKLSADRFEFKAPPGVQVIDQTNQ